MIKQTGRIFQTASENRSIDVYIRLVELVRGGVIGKLRHIEVRLPIGNNVARVGKRGPRPGQAAVQPQEPPKTLNYEMWLGQAPWMPYIPARLHGNFRWNLAFSGGVLTDWGAHMIDLAQWGHNTRAHRPGRGRGARAISRRGTPSTTRPPPSQVHYQYADGVTMTVSAGQGDLDPEQEIRGAGGRPHPAAGHPLRGRPRAGSSRTIGAARCGPAAARCSTR